MSRTVRINATLDADLLARIDAFAAARLEDRSTAIRQLVDQALRDLSKREALQAYQQGRLTLRELALTLRLDVWAAQDLLAAEGVAVAQGGRGETAAGLAGLLGARRDPDPAAAPVIPDDPLVERDGRLVIAPGGFPLTDEDVRAMRDADRR